LFGTSQIFAVALVAAKVSHKIKSLNAILLLQVTAQTLQKDFTAGNKQTFILRFASSTAMFLPIPLLAPVINANDMVMF